MDGNFADVRIISNFSPSSCGQGEVRRGIDSEDGVCVTADEHALVQRQQAERSFRVDFAGNCYNGFIKRNHSRWAAF